VLNRVLDLKGFAEVFMVNLRFAEERCGARMDEVVAHPDHQGVHEDKRSDTDTHRRACDDRASLVTQDVPPGEFDVKPHRYHP